MFGVSFPMTNNDKFRQPLVVGIIDVRVQHTFPAKQRLGMPYAAFTA
jgi:hypothetical protein